MRWASQSTGRAKQLDDERDFLLLVARYAGQAIERLRLLDGERKSRTEADAAASRLALLNQASRAFGDADLDLEARLRGVAAELVHGARQLASTSR